MFTYFLVIYLGFRTPRAVGGFLMVLAGYVAINLHKKHCQWVGEYFQPTYMCHI